MSKNQRIAVMVLCLVLAVLLIGQYASKQSKYKTYTIDINASCIDNDYVGNEWTKTFTMDGHEISSGYTITVPKGDIIKKKIKATITERDKYSDIASTEITFFLYKSESIIKPLIVRENNGRYKGNTATWEIEVSVK